MSETRNMAADLDQSKPNYVVVKVDDDHVGEDWANRMKKRFASSIYDNNSDGGAVGLAPPTEKPPIIRVPPSIRETDPAAYDPTLVSIGPYHHDNPRFKPMEDVKWRYLLDLLARSNARRADLQRCLNFVRELEDEARRYYYGVDGLAFDGEKFSEMLLLDASFIIELFLRQKEDIREDDPICGVAWALPLVGEDLLLVENQLPFSVLQELYFFVFGDSDREKLPFINLALDFYDHDLLTRRGANNGAGYDQFLKLAASGEECFCHLLHLFHSYLRPTTPSPTSDQSMQRSILSSNGLSFRRRLRNSCSDHRPVRVGRSSSTTEPVSIPPATQLQEAGITFKRKDDESTASFLDVKFKDGVMEIPPLSIYYWTNSMFRNFIAFEQNFPAFGCHFTSYAVLMDCIVNTGGDVAALVQQKIIVHGLGSDEEVALMFNGLGKGVNLVLGDTYLPDLFEQVNKYAKDPWHEWRAMLVRNYFKSPWAAISFVAGIVAFLMSFVIVFYTIYSYYHPLPGLGSDMNRLTSADPGILLSSQ